MTYTEAAGKISATTGIARPSRGGRYVRGLPGYGGLWLADAATGRVLLSFAPGGDDMAAADWETVPVAEQDPMAQTGDKDGSFVRASQAGERMRKITEARMRRAAAESRGEEADGETVRASMS